MCSQIWWWVSEVGLQLGFRLGDWGLWSRFSEAEVESLWLGLELGSWKVEELGSGLESLGLGLGLGSWEVGELGLELGSWGLGGVKTIGFYAKGFGNGMNARKCSVRT